jgi:hypothetical protein
MAAVNDAIGDCTPNVDSGCESKRKEERGLRKLLLLFLHLREWRILRNCQKKIGKED